MWYSIERDMVRFMLAERDEYGLRYVNVWGQFLFFIFCVELFAKTKFLGNVKLKFKLLYWEFYICMPIKVD